MTVPYEEAADEETDVPMDKDDEHLYWSRETWLQTRGVKHLLLWLVLIQLWDKVLAPVLRLAGFDVFPES